MNELVEYLSNSSDIYVINYLNEYPFAAGRRKLPGIIETTHKLLDRIAK